MKQKRPKVPKQRNPYVQHMTKRVAGAHDKPYKSKRKREKQNFTEKIRTGSSEEEHLTLGKRLKPVVVRVYYSTINQGVEISKFSRFTKIILTIH
jgi:hypothetical protein